MDDSATFLAAEADAWAPYTALGGLSDADLERPVEAAHGWSGRDLMAHLAFWQGIAVGIARDLAASDVSETHAATDARWDAGGDDWNAEILADWRALPLAEVRARFRDTPAALRQALAAAPVERWWGNESEREMILDETIGHYADHPADLAAILAAAGG
jgi:hypothetical protein